jgi:hypothetical protein
MEAEMRRHSEEHRPVQAQQGDLLVAGLPWSG